jgi:hypothetical protein
VRSPNFRDYSRIVEAGDAYDDDLNAIIDEISRGGGVSERFYRAGIDSDHDTLLEQEGVIHLHLGGKNSDVLLFLVQYADRVVLLEINTHKHFKTDPIGTLLRSLHEQHLLRATAEELAKMQQAIDVATAAQGQGRATAMERLKAEAALRRLGKDGE